MDLPAGDWYGKVFAVNVGSLTANDDNWIGVSDGGSATNNPSSGRLTISGSSFRYSVTGMRTVFLSSGGSASFTYSPGDGQATVTYMVLFNTRPSISTDYIADVSFGGSFSPSLYLYWRDYSGSYHTKSATPTSYMVAPVFSALPADDANLVYGSFASIPGIVAGDAIVFDGYDTTTSWAVPSVAGSRASYLAGYAFQITYNPIEETSDTVRLQNYTVDVYAGFQGSNLQVSDQFTGSDTDPSQPGGGDGGDGDDNAPTLGFLASILAAIRSIVDFITNIPGFVISLVLPTPDMLSNFMEGLPEKFAGNGNAVSDLISMLASTASSLTAPFLVSNLPEASVNFPGVYVSDFGDGIFGANAPGDTSGVAIIPPFVIDDSVAGPILDYVRPILVFILGLLAFYSVVSSSWFAISYLFTHLIRGADSPHDILVRWYGSVVSALFPSSGDNPAVFDSWSVPEKEEW